MCVSACGQRPCGRSECWCSGWQPLLSSRNQCLRDVRGPESWDLVRGHRSLLDDAGVRKPKKEHLEQGVMRTKNCMKTVSHFWLLGGRKSICWFIAEVKQMPLSGIAQHSLKPSMVPLWPRRRLKQLCVEVVARVGKERRPLQLAKNQSLR